MRQIRRAVLKQTIEHGFMRTEKSEDHPGQEPTVFLTRAGVEAVVLLLKKYITYNDKFQAYWVDRYWYFDVEKYENDLRAFGIDIPAALLEQIVLPTV